MKIPKILVHILFWAGLVISVAGAIMGLISDASYLGANPFSLQSLALLFGQIASPVWEGLALITGAVIIGRLYGAS
ncbi:MAG: hypothetical protein C7B45_02615 [Sulfobacillus acidophilus]|uniref:Uncharacterized protein n=1 Tax=Sulfobacillus acidophilus TaxID=53633 RepID=A0A2T2WN85_9FIRM|nr:MAG: hypothetical protein C7B45_02615 [Sulfobacillus acidophilus]